MERIARRFLGSLFLASGITLATAGLLPAMAGLGVALSGVNLIARTIDNRGFVAHLRDRIVRRRLRHLSQYRKEKFGASSA
jgi:hypothetical protein